MPLLALLLIGASAAVLSPDQAVRVARTAIQRGEFVRAEEIIDGTLKVHGKRDTEAVWMLRVLLGEALSSRQDKRAPNVLGFTLPPKYARSEVAVHHFIQRGMVQVIFNNGNGARKSFESAQTIAEKHQPQTLAYVYRALGVVDESNRERYSRKAIALAQKDQLPFVEAKAWLSIGHLYVLQGRYNDAIEVFERVRKIADAAGFQMTVQNAQGNLGWAYVELGEYEDAEKLFQEAEATARRIGAKREQVPWLIQLGALSHQKRAYAEATRYSQAALAVDPKHEQAKYAYANLASAAIELGRYAEARRYNAEGRSRVIDARIAMHAGDPARAKKLLLDVITTTNKDEDKSTKWEAQARLADVYACMGRIDGARRYYDDAFKTARKTRAKVPQELSLSFFNLVEEILDRHVNFLVANNRIDEALTVMERSRAESLEDGRTEQQKFDARAIARKTGAVILSYWLGRDRSYVFVVRPDGVTVHDLRRSDTLIEKAVAKHRNALLTARNLERVQQSGAELYSMLVAPAAVQKNSRVMIVADGALHTLNFETLVPSPGRWWIEDVNITHAGSLQLMLDPRTAKPSADPAILLVGDTPSPGPEFPALQHAAQEMSAIASRFRRRTVLQGSKATPAAYIAASPEKFDYVHFVAHGDARRSRPLDSAVILAPDATKSYRLLARDIMKKPLAARLVTISSCDSAGTRTYAGEGVVGLAWAFQKAGADQVIASLWKVNDSATSTLMDEMYRGIRAGREPAEALREAKLKYVRRSDVRRLPRFWAPFVLYAGT